MAPYLGVRSERDVRIEPRGQDEEVLRALVREKVIAAAAEPAAAPGHAALLARVFGPRDAVVERVGRDAEREDARAVKGDRGAELGADSEDGRAIGERHRPVRRLVAPRIRGVRAADAGGDALDWLEERGAVDVEAGDIERGAVQAGRLRDDALVGLRGAALEVQRAARRAAPVPRDRLRRRGECGVAVGGARHAAEGRERAGRGDRERASKVRIRSARE